MQTGSLMDPMMTYCGTPAYMCPEMQRRYKLDTYKFTERLNRRTGVRIDMWPFGVMLHEVRA